MDTKNIERYAPQARRDFIQAVTDRAAAIGIRVDKGDVVLSDIAAQGDVAFVEGRPFPKALAQQRKGIEDRIKKDGFDRAIEAASYTWFNRLIALRSMEIHGYLDHGYRVLSHPAGETTPEILQHAEQVDLPGLDRQEVIELRLDGTRDEELYRKLLVAQCNDLHRGMPFLFERVNDSSELLLPDNLLHTNSLVRQLVEEIPEEDWQQVEVVGWIYQFYIKERKDEVIGKVVKSEDIPAATQLFTPNWIVQYLVQNSLGRQWMATHPDSPLREHMPYYIEPAEQTEEVRHQLAEITPAHRNPEELTVMDPACGSGHMLIEAYSLLLHIYQERGYRRRDIPRLILEKNLHGLDIDERAVQLAGFALIMRAAADDRRLLGVPVELNVLAMQHTRDMDTTQVALHLGLPVDEVGPLVKAFSDADTFGSLIQLDPGLEAGLAGLDENTRAAIERGDALAAATVGHIAPIVSQAELLAAQYDVVVTNPPYMGSKHLNPPLKRFAGREYQDTKADLFAMFIERAFAFAHDDGQVAMVTMQSWMFLSSFEAMRTRLINSKTLGTMAHLGAGAFGSISGAVVQTTAFSISNSPCSRYRPTFYRLIDGDELCKRKALLGQQNQHCGVAQRDFAKMDGCPIVYWASDSVRDAFAKGQPLAEVAEPRLGMATGDNGRYLRQWYEVQRSKMGVGYTSRQGAVESGHKWFPYRKGGKHRRWFGNNDLVVDWEHDGQALRTTKHPTSDRLWAHNFNLDYIFRPAITWTSTSSSHFDVRHADPGELFDVKGSSCFTNPQDHWWILGYLASSLAGYFMRLLNPTVEFQPGNVGSLPVFPALIRRAASQVEALAKEATDLARADWDAMETSWGFRSTPLVQQNVKQNMVADTFDSWVATCVRATQRMRRVEEENNRLFIEMYGLQDDLSPKVAEDHITLTQADREGTMERLVSYAVGCAMGRYSLSVPGLVYAESGDERFDPSRHVTFPATDDGILVVTPDEWFEDDAANRFDEFLKVAWPEETLEANLAFVADSLSPRKSDTSRETIRRYLAQSFFKDHLQTYKRRPIYWLFTSGKKRAFQALVYLHRYNESTLARMRTSYVIPLMQRMRARTEQLDAERKSGDASATRKRQVEKELNALEDQQAELLAFDEQLQHYAEQQIALDLDDGVKVNYGKFGSLLSDVKAVTGK
jgi:type II restriction/modification system DNA methylase subunit YeeA